MSTPTITDKAGIAGGRLFLLDQHPSSNQWMKDSSIELSHGDVVRVHDQTAGRGRLDRTWVAPAGQSLCLSVYLQTPDLLSHPERCGLSAALAIHDTLSELSIQSQLKWPNDIWVDQKKISGILLEKTSDPAGIILGIGLNVSIPQTVLDAAQLDRPATSILSQLNGAPPLDEVWQLLRHALTVRLLQTNDTAWPQQLAAWTRHDALTGTSVTLRTVTGLATGDYAGLSPDGCLQLKTDSGMVSFLAGDITRVTQT